MTDILSHAQVRGARAMLGWSLVDLAKAASLSVSLVRRAEDERFHPVSDEVAAVIRKTFETRGVRFLPDDGRGVGVRLKVG